MRMVDEIFEEPLRCTVETWIMIVWDWFQVMKRSERCGKFACSSSLVLIGYLALALTSMWISQCAHGETSSAAKCSSGVVLLFEASLRFAMIERRITLSLWYGALNGPDLEGVCSSHFSCCPGVRLCKSAQCMIAVIVPLGCKKQCSSKR